MASLNDILTKVYTITNRPDLVTESTQAVNRALNAAHIGNSGAGSAGSTFFFDLKEEVKTIPVDPSTGQPALNFTFPLPSRFRKFKYTWADPPANFASLIFDNDRKLTYVPPDALFDPSSLMKQTNYFYLAGMNVVFRTSVPRAQLYWGFYRIPSISDSFIATNFSDCIAWKAAAELFAAQDDNKKTYYEQLFQQQKLELFRDYQDV